MRPAPPALLARPWEYNTTRIIKGIKADFVEMVKSRITHFWSGEDAWKELSQRRLHAGG